MTKTDKGQNMKKILIWSLVILVLAIVLFFVYGLWPRVTMKGLADQIGTKYKTIEDLERDLGQPHYKIRTNNESSANYFQYIYVDRFIAPRGTLTVWCDENDKITFGEYKREKHRLTFFPQRSPFIIVSAIEYAIRKGKNRS